MISTDILTNYIVCRLRRSRQVFQLRYTLECSKRHSSTALIESRCGGSTEAAAKLKNSIQLVNEQRCTVACSSCTLHTRSPPCNSRSLCHVDQSSECPSRGSANRSQLLQQKTLRLSASAWSYPLHQRTQRTPPRKACHASAFLCGLSISKFRSGYRR